MKDAEYLGVAPWDLLEQPVIYRRWAQQARKAEGESRRQREASKSRKQGKGIG